METQNIGDIKLIKKALNTQCPESGKSTHLYWTLVSKVYIMYSLQF